jgi:starvation-inducible outer membrane lipoprotein
MSKFLTVAMALVLASCATAPHAPKLPNENKRVPVNRTLPTEIQKVKQ